MSETPIDSLVKRAQDGDDACWLATVQALQDEIALVLAAYATSRAMHEEAVRTTWVACRAALASCPAGDAARPWFRGIAIASLRTLLDRELLPSSDELAQALASPALRALQAATVEVEQQVIQSLRHQLGTLPADQQTLLARRYRNCLELPALAQERGTETFLVAGALFSARAAADWSAASSAQTDGLFPVLIEDFIGGSISPDSRGVLAGCVFKDPTRGMQVARQLRLALLLGALLRLGDQAQAETLAQIGVRKRGDTGAGANKTSRIVTRRHTTMRTRSAAEVDLSENPDAPAPTASRRMVLALALIGVLLLISAASAVVIWHNVHAQGSGAATTGVASAPVLSLPAEDGLPRNAIGRVLVHRNGAFVVSKAERLPCEDDHSLLSGDGLQTGADGELQVLYGEHTRITLVGDTVVASVGASNDRNPLLVQLDHGTLSLSTSGRVLSVSTPSARLEISSGQCQLTAGATSAALEVIRGDAHLMRSDGGAPLSVAAGQRARVGERDGPALVKSGAYLRGINFGGDEVMIRSNLWLSRRAALAAGLTIEPGTQVAPPQAISSSGLDFDYKAMLSSGLIAAAGPVHISQRVPAGEFDLMLWISDADGVSPSGLSLHLQGHVVELGAPAERTASWLRLGPYRVASKSGAIDITIDGLSRTRLSGIEFDSVDGSSIPAGVALISPAPEQSWYSSQDIDLAVDVLGDRDTVAKVQYFDGETLVGESAKAPFNASCRLPAGDHSLSAKATDHAGVAAASAAVAVKVKPAFGSGSISADDYQGINGEAVRDMTGSPQYPDHPNRHRTLNAFEQRKLGFNYGTRIRGYISPPVTGNYELWVAADDSAELWLSSTDQEAGKRRLAFCPSHVGFREWGKFPDQHAKPIALEAGQRYFVEVLYKQGSADDWLSVGWKLPDGQLERPIPGLHLSPIGDNGSKGPSDAPATQATPPASVTAALPSAPAAPPAEPRFVKGIHLGGDAVVVEGNKWLGQRQAESQGLTVKNARKISVFVEPKPTVDAAMKAMLTSGLAASGGNLTLSQHLQSGKYLIYVWTLETVRSESRSFTLDINGSTMADIGVLPMDGWLRYGPCEVEVLDGMLQVSAKAKKGNPQLMGLAIYTPPLSLVADGKGWVVDTAGYHLGISADGCVSNLTIGGQEFLHPVGGLPGGYFMQNGPQKLNFEPLGGDDLLVAKNERVNVRYAFRPNGATLTLNNTSDKPVDWFFLLDPRASIASDGKSYSKMPVRQGWHDSAWFIGQSRLGFIGASQVWPFDQGTEAMQTTIPPMQSRELVLTFGSASSDEQQAAAAALGH